MTKRKKRKKSYQFSVEGTCRHKKSEFKFEGWGVVSDGSLVYFDIIHFEQIVFNKKYMYNTHALEDGFYGVEEK